MPVIVQFTPLLVYNISRIINDITNTPNGKPLNQTILFKTIHFILSSKIPIYEYQIIISFEYIKRLCQITSDLDASKSWITAIILSDYYLNDNSFDLQSWSNVSPYSIQQLKTLQRQFLTTLDYRLHVSEKQLFSWKQRFASMYRQ
jgi:hypothetical protein